MLLIIFCTWFAVRLAIRPLADLASAADALDPNKKSPALSDRGPSEVAHAARAFNAMRDRIAHYLEERVQILAAISHDLQTPITRMRLRADMADDSPEKVKLLHDSAHGNGEKLSRIDLASFVESLCYDYQDTGKPVSVSSMVGGTVATKPHALRRILSNFIDNAWIAARGFRKISSRLLCSPSSGLSNRATGRRAEPASVSPSRSS
jgi:signal transduction histidine kinase